VKEAEARSFQNRLDDDATERKTGIRRQEEEVMHLAMKIARLRQKKAA
jgi:hypothetical protein